MDIDEKLVGIPTVGAVHYLNIYSNPTDPDAPLIQMIGPATGAYDIELLPLVDWAKNWHTITAELKTEASLNQGGVPPFSAYDLFNVHYRIDQHFSCTNTESAEESGWIIPSYSTAPEGQTKCEPSLDDLRVLCFAGRGVSSVLYESSSLASCQGCTIHDRDFLPTLDSTPEVDPKTSGMVCICATGGSGDYSYSILSGSLPSGQELDSETGCITGDPDGQRQGTATITFQVIDRGGGGAPVGSTRTIGGTGYLNGSDFLWASGAAFFPEMAGTPITIGGATHTIATVPTQFHLTV